MKYTRRSFLRKYREAPVEIRQHGTQQSQPAQMSDCCRGGMQLISDRFIEPGAEVVADCPAEVVWCHRCDKGTPNRFPIGVRFVRSLAH